ncbi:hypothetical protein [Glycomyces rhizosphaerae]|uniref:Uncharacterized protein n=1 Tax=Glycomyces rhizosphaerae TaxID=2054422 RepID=A0ABV7Q7A4_9ACTN
MVRLDGVDARLRPSARTGLVDVNLDGQYLTVPGFSGAGMLADPAFRCEITARMPRR